MSDSKRDLQALAVGEDIAKKNAQVNQGILDIAHLFFVYKAHVETKIASILQAAKLFDSSVSKQLEELLHDVDTADYFPDSMDSSLLRDLSIDEDQFRADKKANLARKSKRLQQRAQATRQDKKEPDSLPLDAKMRDLHGKALSDINDAQKQLEELLSLLKFKPERRGGKPPEYQDLLQTVDVEDFLVLANHYFARYKPQLDLQDSRSDFGKSPQQSRDGSLLQANTPREESGLKQSVRKIAELQQLAKSKDQKIKDLQGTLPSPDRFNLAVTEIETLQAENNELLDRERQAGQAVEHMQSEVSGLLAEKETTERIVLDCEKSNEYLTGKLNELTNQIEDLHKEVDELHAQLQEKNQKLQLAVQHSDEIQDLVAEAQSARNSYLIVEAA